MGLLSHGPRTVVKDEKFVEETVTANRTALSLAVLDQAVNCVAYLKEMGARSDHLGSHYDFDLARVG